MSVQKGTVLDKGPRVRAPVTVEWPCANCGQDWVYHCPPYTIWTGGARVDCPGFTDGGPVYGRAEQVPPAAICTGCQRGEEMAQQRLPPARPCTRCGEPTRFVVASP